MNNIFKFTNGWYLRAIACGLALYIFSPSLSAFPSMQKSQTLEEYLARYHPGAIKPRCIRTDLQEVALRLKGGVYVPAGDLDGIIKRLVLIGDAVGAASGYDHRTTINFFVKHPATNSYLAFITVENHDARVSDLVPPAIAVLVIDLRDWRISAVE